MNKIKNILITIGEIVALFLMISPIIIIIEYKSLGNDFWFLLIVSILYDIYFYNQNITNMNLISALKTIRNNVNMIDDKKYDIKWNDKRKKEYLCNVISQTIQETFEENNIK